ncbi:unnamed protein product, partial [Didymodactylos carnosus]
MITISSYDAPWFTNKLRKVNANKQKLYQKYAKSQAATDQQLYLTAAFLFEKECIQAKQAYYSRLQIDVNNSSKKWWTIVKHALGKHKQISIASLHDARTNSMVSHSCEKGEVLNRYFAEVCTPLNTQGHIFPTLPTPKQIMPTFTIDVNEVYYALKKINVMKAVAPGISGRMLKEGAFELAPVLTRLFNHSLSMETFPSQWKLGFVTAIFKQGDVHHPTNYRPITLLSAVSKIFERVIFKRVYTFLIKAREINPNQSDFLPSHSTITQLVQMVHDIALAFNDKHPVVAAFVDFCKAFDKVSHEGLLLKLASKGIRGSLLGWFRSYLNERNIVTMVEGFTSSSARIGCGVPQGSVLGPLLFLLFIDDLPQSMVCTCRLFADDVSLYTVVKTNQDVVNINKDLERVYQWSKDWLQNINVLKCYSLFFTHKATACPPALVLGDTTLRYVDKHTHLGLVLTPNLDWTPHVDNVYSKCSKMIGSLKLLSRCMARRALLLAYHSYVFTIMNY